MRYLALATDYDGTLAAHGSVDEATRAGLERLLDSGRQLILVSGRVLDEMRAIFPSLELFCWCVLENGALLYHPATRTQQRLAEPPPPRFIAELRQRGVERISQGSVIVATWRPHEAAVLDAIRTCGLELQIIFNKDAIMVLPSGVNKAFGLKAALAEMNLSPQNVVAVGDAENDHAFMRLCACSAAVANALSAVKETADIVLRGRQGAGVVELIDELIATDLARYEPRRTQTQN